MSNVSLSGLTLSLSLSKPGYMGESSLLEEPDMYTVIPFGAMIRGRDTRLWNSETNPPRRFELVYRRGVAPLKKTKKGRRGTSLRERVGPRSRRSRPGRSQGASPTTFGCFGTKTDRKTQGGGHTRGGARTTRQRQETRARSSFFVCALEREYEARSVLAKSATWPRAA